MKFVIFEDDYLPPVEVLPNGDSIFLDCQYWFDLEVGDLVQYVVDEPGEGTSLYHVIDKQPTTTDGGFAENVYNIVLRAVS